jgi:hypothetical protein
VYQFWLECKRGKVSTIDTSSWMVLIITSSQVSKKLGLPLDLLNQMVYNKWVDMGSWEKVLRSLWLGPIVSAPLVIWVCWKVKIANFLMIVLLFLGLCLKNYCITNLSFLWNKIFINLTYKGNNTLDSRYSLSNDCLDDIKLNNHIYFIDYTF